MAENLPPPDDKPSTSFEELAALNAGVILEPLVSPTPADKLPWQIVYGLADLPKQFVKDTVLAHAFEAGDEQDKNDEATTMLVKYRDIKHLANTTPVPLLGSEAALQVTRQEKKPETAHQLTERLVFADPDTPNLSKIMWVVGSNPRDPSTLHAIDETFRSKGYDLDEEGPFKQATLEQIEAAYETCLLGRFRVSLEEVGLLLTDWWGTLPSAPTAFSRQIQLGVGTRIAEHVDPHRTAKGLADLIFFADIALGHIAECTESKKVTEDLYLPICEALVRQLGGYSTTTIVKTRQRLSESIERMKQLPTYEGDGEETAVKLLDSLMRVHTVARVIEVLNDTYQTP